MLDVLTDWPSGPSLVRINPALEATSIQNLRGGTNYQGQNLRAPTNGLPLFLGEPSDMCQKHLQP